MAKNARKPKFPKRVAGMKVPKPMRKTGTGLMRFAATPLGSALIADLMIAGAARVAQDRRVRAAAAEAGREATRFGSNVLGVVQSAAGAAAAPILAAAHAARHPPDEAPAARREPAETKKAATARRKAGETTLAEARH